MSSVLKKADKLNLSLSLSGPLGTNFSEILIKIYRVSSKKMHLKMSSGKWRPFCFGLNVLIMPVSNNKHKSLLTPCSVELDFIAFYMHGFG